MPDVTNQQLLDAMTQQFATIADNMATKEDINDLRMDITGDINSLRSDINADITSLRSEIAELRREQAKTNAHLDSLESEGKALRNDIKEIYSSIAKLEKKLALVSPEDYTDIRHDLAEIKAWAREVSAKTGISLPRSFKAK